MKKNIAILGSSGGNLFNLGGNDPKNLLGEIIQQCEVAGFNIAHIQFIAATNSTDRITKNTKAVLYNWENEELISGELLSLEKINQTVKENDNIIAEEIKNGHIDGLILMSSDPKEINNYSIKAAAEKSIPIVGTGGTSMAIVNSMHGNVIATSGTTGTTNRTRAISAVSHLSKHWGIKYNFAIRNPDNKNSNDNVTSNPFKKIKFRGIMMASLPAFIALALTVAMSRIPGLEIMGDAFDILITALPVVLSAIAAKQISDLDEVGIVAGVVAGLLSTEGGIVGGLIAGIIAGILAHYIFKKAIEWKFPMTTVNIITGGISGLISGLFVYLLIAPIAAGLGNQIRVIINMAIDINPILAGAIAGLLIWPAILMGIYHAAILPIILLELELTGNSFIGAIDVVGLGMVAMGINLANIIFPRVKGERALAWPGFLILFGFGTYVESAYPFMFSNKIVFGGALLSAGLAGSFIGVFNARGVGYVPTVVKPFLSNNIPGYIIAMLVGLTAAFIITALANKLSKKTKVRSEV